MEIKSLEPLLGEHPFFADLAVEHRALIAGCASNERFNGGTLLLREGEPADRFFVIRHGKVAIDVFAPERGAITIQTLEDGDVLGFSALFPPYRWQFDARALELTRVLAFDAACLRKKFTDDPRLGFELTTRFARIMQERLQALQMQLLDLYGKHSSNHPA